MDCGADFSINLHPPRTAVNIQYIVCVFTLKRERGRCHRFRAYLYLEIHIDIHAWVKIAVRRENYSNAQVHTYMHTQTLGTWSSLLCFYDNNVQLSQQDPCTRHMLVMSILTSAPCCCLQIVVSCCSHAGSVARVHV